MPESEGGHVALFIDWDNLAISTAADHSGAPPDLRRILQVAQSYGTVLVARAYAEWGVTSDRLTVYRAGIEPVYAPTFRFEADLPGQPSRGKSLADPCLVADCVDTLHLHPQIDTFLIVSGDKDLIPIVRLAQLRGKKVVVIGPDLVAAVLKEMADEYVAYRSLIAGSAEVRSATVRAEAAELGRRRRRRRGRSGDGAAPGDAAAEEAVEPSPAPEPPPRHERRERRPFADRAGVLRSRPEAEPAAPEEAAAAEPAHAEPPAAEPSRPEPAAAAPAPPPAPAVPEAAEAAPGAETDRSELFATIAQILRERISAGRPRLRATNLKDYLIAKVPGFNERKYGFRQFRELLDAAQTAGVVQIADEGQVQWISPPEAGVRAPAVPAAAPPEVVRPPAAQTAPAQPAAAEPAPPLLDPAEAVAALVELRHRAPALTQGVVNGALAALAASRGAGDRADEEAHRALDQLVADGAVRIDREPQEVELNGARHRVRLCHLVDENPLVRRAEAALHQAAPGETAAAPEAAGEAPRGRRSRRGRGGRGASAAAQPAGEGAPAGAESAAPPPEPAPAAQPEAPAPRRRGGRTEASPGIPPEVLDALVAAVRESIPPDRDTAGAAGVKSRLTRALGTFDEGELGFSKFKDFLQAAEKSGRVRVESAGAATRVGLPEGA
ncbi:MAG TPA: NYN domain-containing protein [Chloroflexota bacterium]